MRSLDTDLKTSYIFVPAVFVVIQRVMNSIETQCVCVCFELSVNHTITLSVYDCMNTLITLYRFAFKMKHISQTIVLYE